MKRGAMRRSQPKRDWEAARAKCDAEGCRICGLPAEASHIIGREMDVHQPIDFTLATDQGDVDWKPYVVWPDRIVPLCPSHHRTGLQAYDAGTLDLLPHLTLPETLQAVADAGSLELARKRLAPSCYRRSE